MVNAVILAGAPNTGPLRECSPEPNEALIDISGRPMVQYVIDSLTASGRVGRIAVVSPPGQVEPHVTGANLQFIPSTDHIVENIRAAAAALPSDQSFLIATSDIPLLTPAAVSGFLDLCTHRPADLYYPVVEKSVNERAYPGVRRTYVHLRDGIFTGGNLFLINPAIVERCAPKVRRFLEYRKQPLKMAGLLGWSFILRLLLHTLSLDELEGTVSRLWDIRGAVVVCPYPEVGIDVDKPSDLQVARSVLST